jgi:amino acid adenylation domain-containing protein/thioester reductase-like protein
MKPNTLNSNSLKVNLSVGAELQPLWQSENFANVDDLTNLCLHQLFELQVERTPNHVAVIFEGHQLTYQELNDRANQLAHYLRRLGVGSEVLVGICMERSLAMVIGLLGILKAGSAYVPLDPAYPQERLAFMVTDAQLSVVVTEQPLLGKLPHHSAAVVCLDKDWDQIAQERRQNPHSGVTVNNLAYTIYTSGSTGQPKGVQVLHQGVTNFLLSMQEVPGIVEQDILLAVTTICFDIAALELYLPLIVGARVVLVAREVASDSVRLADVLMRSGATIMQATPATWRLLLAAGWQGNPQLKLLCGGEALPRDLADQLLKRTASVWNLYGPTETTIWSVIHRVEAGNSVIPIGQPIANTQIYLVDLESQSREHTLRLVPPGQPGELLIGGMGLARGYRNRPELTEERFIPNPFSSQPDARLYRTGDLARYLPDGNLAYIGRIDHQVKIRGYRIELGEIEDTLYQHEAVRETVVIARKDQSGEQSLVAYLVPRSTPINISQLQAFLKKTLPDYMVPSLFVVMDALPLTPNGKIDRRALPAPKPAKSDANFVAPRNLVEQQLAEIWRRVLALEQVGIHDHFFDLGGHSLLAAQFLAQVREAFQIELPLTVLFDQPTIAGLAEAIARVKDSGFSNLNSTLTEAIHADLNLDATIQPNPPGCYPDAPARHIFLTGVTGFLGAFLLSELLQQTEAQIHCLMRAVSVEDAKQKIAANLNRYCLPTEGLGDRVTPILGDLSLPSLGLSPQQFQALAADIDLIYHNGAFVNLIYPYSALRAVNVLGTQEILRLASLTKIKPVHFISTLDVFQSPNYVGRTVVLEEEHPACGAELSDGYAQSKWVAEKLVMTAHTRGIPTCIYRPGMITGHSQTGASQPNDLVSRLIKGLTQLGIAPDLDLPMSLTPVDYVSRAIVHLSQQVTSWGKAFHLVTPQTLPFRHLVDEIQNFGYSIQWTDYHQWQSTLHRVATEQDHTLSPLLFWFTDWGIDDQLPYLQTSTLVSQAFDCRNTLTGLAGTEIVCPIVDAKLLRAYFANLIPRSTTDLNCL